MHQFYFVSNKDLDGNPGNFDSEFDTKLKIMDFLDIENLVLGFAIGLSVWVTVGFFESLLENNKVQKLNQDGFQNPVNETNNDFLEIPLQEIVIRDYKGNKKDFDYLIRKIQAFKNRNAFYKNRDFHLNNDFSDFN